MKKLLLIITLLCVVIVSNSYNYPARNTGDKVQAYKYKTLEIMYDSKKRPHKIIIYSDIYSMTAIDLDAGIYINK